MRERLVARWGQARFDAMSAMALEQDQLEVWQGLIASSAFFVEQLIRHSDWIESQLLQKDAIEAHQYAADQWRAQPALQDSAAHADEATFSAILRRFRQRHMVRILWRERSGLASVDDTLEALSDLADTCIREAELFAREALRPRYGLPMGRDSGAEQRLIVLGMGKLGGEELNFSSDIDLIFAFDEPGHTAGGRESTDNQNYFHRLGQLVIRLLDAVTEEGFVFRVDMRLRPYGDSGALVGDFTSLELYYQDQGREWERYAMVKARAITGTQQSIERLLQMLRAFVYRRYTDFSVIAALRDMKAMMRSEVARLGGDADLKKGAGGIREVEFIVQSLQLIHGGRASELRPANLLTALAALAHAEVLPAADAERLSTHYRLMRRVENMLQAMQDRQTQKLPVESIPRAQLAWLVGCEDWPQLEQALARSRHEVGDYFSQLIAEPGDNESRPFEDDVQLVELSETGLAALGFSDSEETWAELAALLESRWVAGLAGEGRARLERFLPLLCRSAADQPQPDLTLRRALPFVRAVCRRSAYLVLLQENPKALSHLLSLVASSSWIAERLAARPELVDELLNEARLYSAPSKEELQSLMRQQLLRVPEEDLEGQINALGRIKDGVVLRVAASEVAGTLPIMKVSDNLTFLAEVLVEQAIAVARAELVQRHGEPQGVEAGFAVLAYGKLGGIELSYGSDLDLVFVFGGASGETAGPKVIDNSRFYTRLAQRVVHVLSSQTPFGRLYEVDLRLRPNGDSGLVATTLAAIRRYQFESAWTWEHQALVRSRTVAGDAGLREALEALRVEVLRLPRSSQPLADDVISMRHKMLAERPPVGRAECDFDLKHDAGGIVDIEFMVQYLVLAHAHQLPDIAVWSDVVRLLESLQQAGVVSEQVAEALRVSYLDYRSAIHALALQGAPPVSSASQFSEQRRQVLVAAEAVLPGLQVRASDA